MHQGKAWNPGFHQETTRKVPGTRVRNRPRVGKGAFHQVNAWKIPGESARSRRRGKHQGNAWKTPGILQAHSWYFPGEKLESDADSRYIPGIFQASSRHLPGGKLELHVHPAATFAQENTRKLLGFTSVWAPTRSKTDRLVFSWYFPGVFLVCL